MAPNCSKLVSKKLETSVRAKTCMNCPKICTNWPKICTNSPKICTNFPKRCLRNTVARSLNNFRIYGTPPSPGVCKHTEGEEEQSQNSSSGCPFLLPGNGSRLIKLLSKLQQDQKGVIRWGSAHWQIAIGCTPRGSCNNTLLEGFFGRLFNSMCFFEGFGKGFQ